MTWYNWVAVVYVGVVTALGWIGIPSGERVAIHWGLSGQANGYASKPVALLLVPLLMGFIIWRQSAAGSDEGGAIAVRLFALGVLAAAQSLIVFLALSRN